MRRLLPFLFLLSAAAMAAPKWVEVRSANFDVVSDGGAGRARHIAAQLEQMRAAFRAMFPRLALPGRAVQVLAVKGQDEFQALIPREDVGRGRVKWASYYQQGPDRSFILVDLEADAGNDDFPYETVYSSYAMSMVASDSAAPLWLRQGLGEFYGTTRIEDKAVTLGLIDPYRLATLRESFHLLPTATLLGVTEHSPYYQREGKAEPFFSECWLLTHYLLLQDQSAHGHRLQDYLQRVDGGADPVAAGRQAFGDLAKLDEDLAQYLRHMAFPAARIAMAAGDEAKLPAEPISATAADGARADFQVHVGRTDEGTSLARTVLAADARNLNAHEALAYAADRGGNAAAALDQLQQVLALGTDSAYLNYRYAALELRQGGGSLDAATASKVEAALQAAIQREPGYADSYAQLAFLYASRGEKADEADHLELEAIAMAPRVINYRLNRASLLLRAHRVDDAVAVLKAARPLAATPQEESQCDAMLANAEQVQALLAERAAEARDAAPPTAAPTTAGAPDDVPGPPRLIRREAMATTEPKLDGPRHVVTGNIAGVRCGFTKSATGQTVFSLDLDLTQANGATETLHSADYLKVPFRATNFTPSGVLNPCADLKGLHARANAAGDQLLSLDVSR